MRLLILVFAVSILALLWVAWAIARAIRKHGQPPQGSTTSLGLQEPGAHGNNSGNEAGDEPEEY